MTSSRPPTVSQIRRQRLAGSLSVILLLGTVGCATQWQTYQGEAQATAAPAGEPVLLERQARQWAGEGPNARLRWMATVVEVNGRRVDPDAGTLALPAGDHQITVRCSIPPGGATRLAQLSPNPGEHRAVTETLRLRLLPGAHYYPHVISIPPQARDAQDSPCQTALHPSEPLLVASR
ncbi:hypothetical protein [Ideonella livida]|uniref:Uncharacterized protein n=1 Tax=Ideonella livida TaxID=2707176 RepID=A0A7C9TI71_9BURK|nr:hypothetical protein [Ideonella livida]NDY91061.1 hypothetical protein [Ideonella livida]